MDPLHVDGKARKKNCLFYLGGASGDSVRTQLSRLLVDGKAIIFSSKTKLNDSLAEVLSQLWCKTADRIGKILSGMWIRFSSDSGSR